MATLDERFEKGLEMRGRLAGGQGRIYKGAVPAAYDLAPDMYRISTESLYGSIWSRPGLELRYRAIDPDGRRHPAHHAGPITRPQCSECGYHSGGDHRDTHDGRLLRWHPGCL